MWGWGLDAHVCPSVCMCTCVLVHVYGPTVRSRPDGLSERGCQEKRSWKVLWIDLGPIPPSSEPTRLEGNFRNYVRFTLYGPDVVPSRDTRITHPDPDSHPWDPRQEKCVVVRPKDSEVSR